MQKTLIVSTLTLLAGLSAQAADKVTIECNGGAEHVRLSGDAYNVISGSLMDQYNGANLACRNFSYQNLENAGGTLSCVGLWNAAFDEGSNDLNKVVLVTLKKQATGQITAEYKRDWDARDHHAPEKITLTCSVQES